MIAPIMCSRLWGCEQGLQFVIDQIADTLDRKIGSWISGDVVRVERVVSLAREYGCQLISPELFHRRRKAQLVVHIQQEHHFVCRCHVVVSTGMGLCQLPSAAMSASACFGPQLPGS